MIKPLAALSALTLLVLTACVQDDVAQDDVANVEEIDDVVAKLDEAFETRNAEAAKALMTQGHLAVTPYYSTPRTFDEVVATLADYKIEQTDLSEPEVVMMGPDHAMRTLTAKLEGTFKDRTISSKVFITSILVRQDGKWLEHFYQVTALAP